MKYPVKFTGYQNTIMNKKDPSSANIKTLSDKANSQKVNKI